MSKKGNRYIYIMYVYYCNAIIKTPINNRSEKDMIHAFTELTTYLKSLGINPGFHSTENEASIALTKSMATMNIKYQLVPPINNIANNAEREINNFNNHFIEGLCSVDADFRLQLWIRMIPQTRIILNLLQQSRLNSHLSEYTHIYGYFDFNHTPLALPCTRVVIHNRPKDISSWAPHGESGW